MPRTETMAVYSEIAKKRTHYNIMWRTQRVLIVKGVRTYI